MSNRNSRSERQQATRVERESGVTIWFANQPTYDVYASDLEEQIRLQRVLQLHMPAMVRSWRELQSRGLSGCGGPCRDRT